VAHERLISPVPDAGPSRSIVLSSPAEVLPDTVPPCQQLLEDKKPKEQQVFCWELYLPLSFPHPHDTTPGSAAFLTATSPLERQTKRGFEQRTGRKGSWPRRAKKVGIENEECRWLRHHNLRMAEVGRDLWGSCCPTLCSSRATQSWLPSSMSKQLFSISRNGESATSLGILCQCSVTLTVKKCFLVFTGNLLVFQFVLVASGPVTGHH